MMPAGVRRAWLGARSWLGVGPSLGAWLCFLAFPTFAETPPDRIFQQPPPRVTPAPGPAARPNTPRTPRPASPSLTAPKAETDANRPAMGASDAKVLADLSEVLGALAFLHSLCTPAESANPWRVRMEAFLDAEAANSGVGDMLRGAYNHGFTALSAAHRQCNEAARAASTLFRQDAARLAREADRRFGG